MFDNRLIKIIYCGTGGAERVHIRSDGIYTRANSCIHIEFNNKHIQVDCPPDMPNSFLDCNLKLSEIDYLLITHSHKDHCYPYDIINAKIGNYAYPAELKDGTIEIYANNEVSNIIFNIAIQTKQEIEKRNHGFSIKKNNNEKIRVHVIESGKKELLFENVEILPIGTDHQNGTAFGYILRFIETSIIYIPDFGSITNQMHEIILSEGTKHKFDLVVFGCPVPYPAITEPFHSHAELKIILDYFIKLFELDVLKKKCNLHITHLSPRWMNPEVLERALNGIKDKGLEKRTILVTDKDIYKISC